MSKSAMVLRIVAVWFIVASARGTAAEPTTMKIHTDRPGVKISPMLYGIFFEEINRAGDGGIYAEMIQNRSFEDDRGGNEAKPAKVPGWTLVKREDVEATMNIDSSQPINAKNPNSLRLDIGKADTVRVGVANEGFRGIAVRKGDEYLFSMYARSGNGLQGPVTVSIRMVSGSPPRRRSKASVRSGRSSVARSPPPTRRSPLNLSLPFRRRDVLDRPGLALSQGNLERPAQRSAGRPGRDAGRDEAGVRPLPRRVLRRKATGWPTPSAGRTASATRRSGPATGISGATAPPTAWAITNTCKCAKTSAPSRSS